MTRFVIHETWGYRKPFTSNSKAPSNVTVTVHDSVYLYRVVGLFRSEDAQKGRRSHDAAIARARAAADRLATLLEDEAAGDEA